MKRIKIIITILYVFFAAEIVGAWSNTPKAKETAAFSNSFNPRWIEEENEAAVEEIEARENYAQMKCLEREKSNEYYTVVNNKEEKEREQLREKEENRKRRRLEKKEEEQRILERIVEAEAGGQDLKGRILVANVILNRVKSNKFPNTVKGVVFAHRQFSPIQNGRYYQVTISSLTKKAVNKAMNGVDYSSGALYFMCRSAADASNVSWFDRALTRVKIHGCHEFFR